MLRKVAEVDCTVLCTIHQPSSEIFYLFDVVIFMKAGKIFYQGPVKNVIAHFKSFGFECPSNYNPSDFVMYLSQTESGTHQPMLDTVITLIDSHWTFTNSETDASSKGLFMGPPAELLEHNESIRLDDLSVEFKVERSFIRQLAALTIRGKAATNT